MNAGALERFRWQRPKNAGHLAPNGIDQPQFFVDVSLVIGEMFGKLLMESTSERRLILGDDVLHSVGVDRLKIGDVANDLLG